MARFTNKAADKAGGVPFWAGNPRGRVDEAADDSYYWADESEPYEPVPYGFDEPDIADGPTRGWPTRGWPTRGWPERVPPRYVRVAVRPQPRRADTRPTVRGVARRRRVPLKVKWAAAIAVLALIFRKAIAFAVITALSGALHLVGINVHLPHLKLSWPWQSITAGTTTDTLLGPFVLQKIEGISQPALGTENFNFVFTHKVSKSIGFWPCWYSSTFDAVGHASATVNLNPGPSWWTPASRHYLLRVLSRPLQGTPGRVMVTVVLPAPQLPRSVHDVTVDNTLSHPVDTQHSWTYPGFGCGGLIRPQFAESVLYSQAQTIAFQQATHDAQVTRPLIGAAQAEAAQIIRYDFIQPTVNALGYTLAGFTLRWSTAA
jgi:hypothetical protein